METRTDETGCSNIQGQHYEIRSIRCLILKALYKKRRGTEKRSAARRDILKTFKTEHKSLMLIDLGSIIPLYILRKEVIQPHLPIRLPCYDFTPIICPTFGGWLQKVTSPTSGVTNSRGVTGGVYNTRERIHPDILIRDY